MNKILYVARKVKGLSSKRIAAVLSIDEMTYQELELNLSKMTPELSEKLEEVFGIPADFFMIPSVNAIQTQIETMEKHRSLLDTPEFKKGQPGEYLALTKLGFEAIIGKDQQILLLYQLRELQAENLALRRLYEYAKSLREKKTLKKKLESALR